MNSVRHRMGFEDGKKDKGYYKNPENIKKEFRKIAKQNPQFKKSLPSAHWLQSNGHAALYTGILNSYGSYSKFRSQKGLPDLQVQTGKWKDLEFTLQEAEKVMAEHDLKAFPGTWTLNKLRYSSLGAAIQKYHGGMERFRRTLHERLSIVSNQDDGLLEQYVGGGNNG
jgi:hypothetical protein